MFSPLARGIASWEGDVECEDDFDQKSPTAPLLPQLLMPASARTKSAKSTSSYVLDDGQLLLPRTYVTRKGAILLFTPSDELCNHGNRESHLKKDNVYEAGLKLRTLGNLTNSVLEFGKEDEEAWEGIPDNPKEALEKEHQHNRDKTLFLRFLHYLDSDNLTADKHVQPGADPEYYLEELKKSSGHNLQRRFRSHTQFSIRTSEVSNSYSHFLEGDDEITSIIDDYMKYSRPGWSQDKQHLEHGVVSTDHMPDISAEGHEASDDFLNLNHTTFSPSLPSMSSSSFYETDDWISRPKTAPIPPALESPRANPRITSAKPPPVLRALGSTPDHLDEIINADVGFGRHHWRKPSRSPSPSFHLGSSRGATPECTRFQRLSSPDGKNEEWNRAAHTIEEEDEASIPSNRGGSEKGGRPTSAGSLLWSGKDEKINVQRRASSAGTANRGSRTSARSSRSFSSSSVSNVNNRTPSAMSRDQERLIAFLPDSDGSVRDANSPTWPGMPPDFSTLQYDFVDGVDQNSGKQLSRDIADSRTASPSRDSLGSPFPDRVVSTSPGSIMTPSRDGVPSPSRESRVQSPSPPARSFSATSRITSPSTRPHSVQSRGTKECQSRVSSAASLDANHHWEGILRATDDNEERKDSFSSRETTVASRQSDLNLGQTRFESDTRTSSAKLVSRGAGGNVTSDSETDLDQVSEAEGRSQSVVEGVSEDILSEEDTFDQERSGVIEGATEESELRDANERDDAQELDVSPPKDSTEAEIPPVPSLNTEEGFTPDSTSPGTPFNTTEHREKQQETPLMEPAVTDIKEPAASVISQEPLEDELSEFASTSVEADRTGGLTREGDRPIMEATITDEDSDVDVESGLESSLTNVAVNSHGTNENPLITEEKQLRTLTEVASASSPAPIKADQILHKELLTETGLDVQGRVEDGRPLSPYRELIDIEKSRPSTPVKEEQRNNPVDVGEAVRTYLESGKEPQIRERSARSRQGSEPGNEEKETVTEKTQSASDMEMTQPVISLTASSKPEVAQTLRKKERTKSQLSTLSEKPKGLAGGKDVKGKTDLKPDLPRLSLIKSDDKGTEVKEPTDKEREARRKMVSSLLLKQEAPERGKLELEGMGKEGEEGEAVLEGLVTRTRPTVSEKTKNDLSDLAALVAKNRTPSKPKEKKPGSKTKLGKVSKSAKKKSEIDPNDIDFEAFNTPEMLQGMDDELRQFIQEQNKSDITSSIAKEPAAASVGYENVKRQESVQTLEVPQLVQKVSPEQRDAHAPSKPKKPSKKEQAKIRADHRKQERMRKEEEKKLKEEEMRLLKEREEEAVRAKAEAEEKQRNIEEEKLKRLAEEDEARKQEEEALEKLKEAKRKAREERESRRAAEAERRRLEVQKKREEKKKREEELKEREKELEQRRVDHEKRMAEIEEARRRREELERLEEEQRHEEERLLALQEEEEERRLEEAKIREAEEELLRIQEEREYREQMRRIAEMQEAKLRQEEEERLRREEEERQRMEEEMRKREEEEQKRVREEQRRIEMARRLEALARMRSAEAAARRKALLLKRRESNVERMRNLKNTRSGQQITRAFVFTYYLNIPRKVWEVPIGFNKKKRGYGAPRKKPAPPNPP